MSAAQQMLFTGQKPEYQKEYTAPGTYTFTVPPGVPVISILGIGPGGINTGPANGGGGGALAYLNNYSVTPGTVLTIVVGMYGYYSPYTIYLPSDTVVSLGATVVLKAVAGNFSQGGAASACVGTAAFSGGDGSGGDGNGGGGGGGAAGYSGAGGNANIRHLSEPRQGENGTGGGAAGGASAASSGNGSGKGGGGVGLYGQGSNGVGSQYGRAGGGSGGEPGGAANTYVIDNLIGGNFGGGAGGRGSGAGNSQFYRSGGGAVRIIWPGNLRQFPSTRTADE